MKTIFSKFMAFSISIVIFCTTILFAVSIFFINSYATNSNTETLVKNAERISSLTEFLSRNYNEMSRMFYMETINTMANSSGTYIIMTDISGKITNYSSNTEDFIINGNGNLDVSGLSDVLSGRVVVKNGVYNNVFGRRTLTVSTPIVAGGGIHGFVLVNYPVPFMAVDVKNLASLMAISVLVAVIICLAFSYFLSRKISDSVSDLRYSARRIARGEFNHRSPSNDIQELNELSESFNTMAEELGRIDQARSDFISNVSHDLRTPMTSISGFVDGILDGTIPSEYQERYLKIVSGEVKRLSNLVNVFLDTSRYEMGEINLNIVSFNLCEVVRTVIAAQESAITEKEINLNLDFGEENIYAMGDEAAMHRVVANLVDNATKFCNYGGDINITVDVSGQKVVTTVENTGAEISSEDQKYIWERFYKTDKSRAKDKKGSGLGLFIVKNIISQHGEKIVLKSENGRTSFTFSLTQSKS